jgi:thioesterase domain-containing protein
MARHFLPAIRQVQPAGPYFLGGYSTGGLIALELAHILLDAGEAVQPVIFIDTFAAAPAGLFWSLVKRFARAPLGEWKTIVRDGLGRHLEKARNPTAASPESEELEAIVENEKAGALNYIRRDLLFCRVPICLIVSGSPVRLEPDRGWSRFAKSGFERREVRGDHLSILRQPDVLELAALLKTFVDGST